MCKWYPTENRWAQHMIFSSFVSKGRGGRVVQMSVPSVGENIHVAATRCTDLHLGGKGWGSVSLCRCWLKSGTPHQHRTPPAHTWWSKGGTACFHGFNHQRWMGSMCKWYPTENRWAQHMIFSSFVSKGRGGRVVQMSVPSVALLSLPFLFFPASSFHALSSLLLSFYLFHTLSLLFSFFVFQLIFH